MAFLSSWTFLAALALIFAGVVLCIAAQSWGIWLVWAGSAGYPAYLAVTGELGLVPAAVTVGVATALLAIGFQADGWSRRFGFQVRWVNQRSKMGVAIGVLIIFMIAPLLTLPGALVGAWVTEFRTSRDFGDSFRNACGTVVAAFGADGLRVTVAATMAGIFLAGTVGMLAPGL